MCPHFGIVFTRNPFTIRDHWIILGVVTLQFSKGPLGPPIFAGAWLQGNPVQLQRTILPWGKTWRPSLHSSDSGQKNRHKGPISPRLIRETPRQGIFLRYPAYPWIFTFRRPISGTEKTGFQAGRSPEYSFPTGLPFQCESHCMVWRFCGVKLTNDNREKTALFRVRNRGNGFRADMKNMPGMDLLFSVVDNLVEIFYKNVFHPFFGVKIR